MLSFQKWRQGMAPGKPASLQVLISPDIYGTYEVNEKSSVWLTVACMTMWI